MLERARSIAFMLAALLLAGATPSAAGDFCAIDKATSDALAARTAQGSAKLLEAASRAFLALGAADVSRDGFDDHRTASLKLLDDAARAFKDALTQTAELQRADAFLRNRPFDRLRSAFGITPGTLNETRWDIIVKTAQASKAPATELLGVCVAGAETLKYTMSTITPDTTPAMLRRALTSWFSVLSHGALVSDAFDSQVR